MTESIDDSDVAWACDALGLPIGAFGEAGDDDSRCRIMRSMKTLDVEACPGSGKTTLLVAKLAILSRKWRSQRHGLCVLSHTNVARREIETRLGNTTAGQRLLAYPHFVGTIHRFVNEFLALPWLRSLGYHIDRIDDEVCLRRRWTKLPRHIRIGLERNRHSEQNLRFRDTSFALQSLRWGRGTLRADTETYRTIRDACIATVQEGYLCHDETFIWAHDALDHVPSIVDSIRKRFRLLFVDEVQDNNALQDELLYRVFLEGDHPVTRQRFGDSNQSIYQYVGQSRSDFVDGFPASAIRVDMPSSYRFGQSIADLVEPLAVDPQSVRGMRRNSHDGLHSVFLFGDDTIGDVLRCYAGYLATIFSESELRDGLFTAIGAVHRSEEDDKSPRSVRHYWRPYDHNINNSERIPNNFVGCVGLGNQVARLSGEVYSMVEVVAEGLLRVSRVLRPEMKTIAKGSRHRRVLELLGDDHRSRQAYMLLVRRLCVDRIALTKECWECSWKPVVTQIVDAIGGPIDNRSAGQRFLAWQETVADTRQCVGSGRSDNIYRHVVDGIEVRVRVGSIHAAKGETHTSTLVLDTFYRTHHLKSLKTWLGGQKIGGADVARSMQSRLRLHYVAMSRPSRLLCIAVREDALSQADVESLERRGWRVGRVKHEEPEWGS